jgi:hypothetical protein
MLLRVLSAALLAGALGACVSDEEYPPQRGYYESRPVVVTQSSYYDRGYYGDRYVRGYQPPPPPVYRERYDHDRRDWRQSRREDRRDWGQDRRQERREDNRRPDRSRPDMGRSDRSSVAPRPDRQPQGNGITIRQIPNRQKPPADTTNPQVIPAPDGHHRPRY